MRNSYIPTKVLITRSNVYPTVSLSNGFSENNLFSVFMPGKDPRCSVLQAISSENTFSPCFLNRGLEFLNTMSTSPLLGLRTRAREDALQHKSGDRTVASRSKLLQRDVTNTQRKSPQTSLT